jgi:hypothetical protein
MQMEMVDETRNHGFRRVYCANELSFFSPVPHSTASYCKILDVVNNLHIAILNDQVFD